MDTIKPVFSVVLTKQILALVVYNKQIYIIKCSLLVILRSFQSTPDSLCLQQQHEDYYKELHVITGQLVNKPGLVFHA
jgi:hypothetical protein